MSRQITISTAAKRTETRWNTETYWWQDFVRRLGTPVRSTETLAQYLALPKAEQDRRKDVGGFVGGVLRDGRRKASHVVCRDLVTLDFDNIPAGGTDELLRRLGALGVAYAAYSTRKHSPDKPRLRAIIPLAAPVRADEYEPIARYCAAGIGIEWCDPTTFEASRLMYWPSCCADSQYVWCGAVDLPMLDGAALLAMHPDWRDYTTWPTVPNEQREAKHGDKLSDPTVKDGIIGAFCRVYDIHRAIAELIPDAYKHTEDPDRYTYAHGSTAGGAVVYDHGQFLFSHHATDPCSGREVNAFDLVRLHLFGEQDNDCPPNHPHNRLPSYGAMCEYALQLGDVSDDMQARRYEEAVRDFTTEAGAAITGQPAEADLSWLNRLAVNKRTGAYDKTIDNVVVILECDPLLKGCVVYDEFSKWAYVIRSLPWKRLEGRRRAWNDFDDAQLLRYIEKVYNISGKDKVFTAMKAYLDSHAINEVRDYLRGLGWDGVCRLDRLFIDFLGADDSPYVRAATRKAFVAAVARVMEPGCKYDYVPILQGAQGIGKSTILAVMGGQWYSDSLDSFEGKDAAELLQGMWIIELGELAAMNRSDMEAVKHFVSKRDDQYRIPYERQVSVFPRHCVFFGTTNKREHLRDTTGNRRWWPIDCDGSRVRRSIWDELPRERDQLWAEAVMWYSMAEPLRLMPELEQAAAAQQFEHMETDPRTGLVAEWLEQPILMDWYSRSISERLIYWSSDFGRETARPEDRVQRKTVSRQEIWTECLHQDPAKFSRRDAAEIENIMAGIRVWQKRTNAIRNGPYGVERVYERTV